MVISGHSSNQALLPGWIHATCSWDAVAVGASWAAGADAGRFSFSTPLKGEPPDVFAN